MRCEAERGCVAVYPVDVLEVTRTEAEDDGHLSGLGNVRSSVQRRLAAHPVRDEERLECGESGAPCPEGAIAPAEVTEP